MLPSPFPSFVLSIIKLLRTREISVSNTESTTNGRRRSPRFQAGTPAAGTLN